MRNVGCDGEQKIVKEYKRKNPASENQKQDCGL